MASTINADNGVSSGSAGVKTTADSSGVLALQTNGTTAVTVDTSQNVGIGTTSPSGRLHAATASGNCYVYSARASKSTGQVAFQLSGGTSGTDWIIYQPTNSDNLTFFGNSADRATITSGGNFLINNTFGTASKLIVSGDGTSNAAYTCLFSDSNGATLLFARNDGLINTGSRATSPYNNTTASAANMYVDSAGDLYRSTSSLKYKTDVQDATHGLSEVMQLRPVTYKGKNDGDTVFGGLIAEEVHAAGLTEFVQYAADGSPDALAYGNMVSLLVKAIQEQQAMIDDLEAEVAALKAR